MVHGTRQNNRKVNMNKKTLKAEYQPGGSKRHEILEKAVKYISEKRLPSTQNHRHDFLVKYLEMTETEYLEALNKATNGELVRNLWN